MTKISNQYSLTNILTADLANSRLGINNVSPAYSLDLTGTARTSGATYLATASGNVGIGTIIPANALSIDEGTATASYLQFTAGTTTGQLATDGFEVGIDASANAIINQQENLPLMIYTNATERMRITSAGNLCVGNTTEITPTYNSFFLGGSKPALIGIKNAVGADVGYLYVNAGTSLFTLESAGATPLLLSTNGAERMRITSGGNVGIGNTNPTYKLDVQGEVVSRGSATAAYSYEDRNNTSLVYTMYAYAGYTNFYNGGTKAQINMSNGTYTALSDVNKKKDFEQSTIGLSEVLQLKPTLYRLKESEETSPKELGFIAQEVKDHIPQAYVESNMGDELFIGLNQMPIIAALTKAIQELSAENTSLINRIEALENK